MGMVKEEEGAKFVRYFGPLLNALRGLGGSAKADEAVDRVAEDLNLSDEALNEVLPSGGSRFRTRSRGHGSTSRARGSSTLPSMASGV